MKALIFAAGLGTRLKPLTDNMPKALVPIAGKTLLEWQIDQLKRAGITDIMINVHHFPDLIIDYVRQHDSFGCHITISDERELLLDTGGGLRKAWKNDNDNGNHEPILAMNVDILSTIDLPHFIQSFNDTREDGLLVVSQRDTQRYLLFDHDSLLRGWTNLATGEIRPQNLSNDDAQTMCRLAFSGMQILSPTMLPLLDQVAEPKFSMIDFYLRVCNRTRLRAYVPSNYRMMDVGKIDHLKEAEQFAQSL